MPEGNSRAPTAAVRSSTTARPSTNAPTTPNARAGPPTSAAAAPTPIAIGPHPGHPVTAKTIPNMNASEGFGGSARARLQRLVRRSSRRRPTIASSAADSRCSTTAARVRNSATWMIATPTMPRMPSMPITKARTDGSAGSRGRRSRSPDAEILPGASAETTTGTDGSETGDRLSSAPATRPSSGARTAASGMRAIRSSTTRLPHVLWFAHRHLLRPYGAPWRACFDGAS